ncbi:hypothetical protein CgunFtcFv8_013187 [Champsocephalus gunnari]|uniref:Uncharacterized protein n=1 Tax=Champsocephalus gunnari TaxID=52237 RepID=A0AAN8DYY7_CHAGU|nr:hypothetical protein CgunFtcFv8_013187 [Champsocephalus gunnari]
MVHCHNSDQQNRPEQKIFAIAPQFLQGKKRCEHLVSHAKAPPELFIGRVTRFVIRRGPTPPQARPPARHPTLLLRVRTNGALDVPSARGPWCFSSRENSHHDFRQPVIPTVNSLSSEK